MSPASLEGQTLGKYRVLEPLGQGGMARVYRAYHPQLDRYVAIKVLRSDLLEDEFLARFRREAQSVAALRHAHIVQVFDFDFQNDSYYMVMELLEGDTLKARLNEYRARGLNMPAGEVVRILLDVLDGLIYAHGEGMIHRDLKPANIMLTRRGQAVITDFGIAQIVGSTRYTVSGALMGTLNYMAPEQALEGRADARSDIYSLGIVLYEVFTGRPPFDADTPLAILMKHVNDPLPLPAGLGVVMPAPLERVMLKALSKNPDDRYQSAADMAEALRQAAQEAGVELPERIPMMIPPRAPAAGAPPSGAPAAAAPAAAPVGVYSGTARAALADAPFAAGETDPDLAAKLSDRPAALRPPAAQQVPASSRPPAGPQAPAPPQPPKAPARPERLRGPWMPWPAAKAAPERLRGLLMLWLGGVGESQADAATQTPGAAALTERQRRVWTVACAAGVLLALNLCGIVAADTAWRWDLFWPFQVLLAATVLALIMIAIRSIWMLIPAGIALGTAAILAFYGYTQAWRYWYLWLSEPLLVLGTVFVTIFLSTTQRAQARSLAQRLGLVLALAGGGLTTLYLLLVFVRILIGV